jgi:hypothetical protein
MTVRSEAAQMDLMMGKPRDLEPAARLNTIPQGARPEDARQDARIRARSGSFMNIAGKVHIQPQNRKFTSAPRRHSESSWSELSSLITKGVSGWTSILMSSRWNLCWLSCGS